MRKLVGMMLLALSLSACAAGRYDLGFVGNLEVRGHGPLDLLALGDACQDEYELNGPAFALECQKHFNREVGRQMDKDRTELRRLIRQARDHAKERVFYDPDQDRAVTDLVCEVEYGHPSLQLACRAGLSQGAKKAWKEKEKLVEEQRRAAGARGRAAAQGRLTFPVPAVVYPAIPPGRLSNPFPVP